jgi:hypothetical protein
MKKLIPVLIALAIAAAVCAVSAPVVDAQSGYKDGVALNSRGLPVGGAYWAICSSSATEGTSSTPCSPTASIYFDAALTMPMSNNGSLSTPLTTDGLGNFSFYAAPGLYMIQFYGPLINLTFRTIQVSANSTSGGGCTSGCVQTLPSGNQTVTQPSGTSLTVTGGNGLVVSQENATVYVNAPGSDAGTTINNCLTAARNIVSSANAQSGVCDARGLTGVLTSTHHLSIPAGVTLLWGQAQLTISDSVTNDAIELAGDGGGVVGMNESGLGTIPRPQLSGYIACGTSGCTTVDNPTSASVNVDWTQINHMALFATGSGSVVINLTSVGHSRIQDNQLTVGTGGSSYGIFGDTSSGELDSTNDIIQHNEINLESSNDKCVRLAGIFNINVLEINSCYMAAANTGQEGFIYAKDSGGNYPNNSLVYGNDAEQGGSGTSFGTIGYDIQGATSITVSNNRCEKIYACFKPPADGSAIGIHLIDPYLSISNQIQLLPNEPQSAEVAIDNNGHNWLPSMHFGQNDLAATNMLGNADFEAWTNSTTLLYWGGVTGTSINQAGSGIYAQNASGSGISDTTTQGSYNVLIGDNATLGLGINSGCVQVDATMNYTLAFRVASTSTSVKFRPGFRFYSDPNCTEADKITNIATNARVLSPQNYAGQSALLGTTGPNWQTTNASLTYNNGITCNCNVTGADWTVGTASTWTPTRNYAITFRVPNAYASSTTVAQSMRVFILENTAANPNQIYVDDIALSEGPVQSRVPFDQPVKDANGAMYGNPTVNGNPHATATGSFTANDAACVNANNSGTAPLVLKDCGGAPLTTGSGLELPFATKAASFSLTAAQANVELTGTTAGQTVTIPHALPAANTSSLWFVWNNSNQTWTEACDSGNIIGTGSSGASTTLAADFWNLLTSDGTNCWVLASGSGSGGANTALSNLTSPTSINQTLTPSAVNSWFLGTLALPWTAVTVGQTANQSGQILGSNLTGNRGYQLPDASGTLMLTATQLAAAQMPVLTGDVTTPGASLATTVAKIQGNCFTLTSPVTGQFIQYNGTCFVNTPGQFGSNLQTGSSYTLLSSDRGLTVVATNSGAQAYTLPQAGSTGFASNYYAVIANFPNSTTTSTGPVTVTTSTSVFENLPGQPSSFVLYQNQRAEVVSLDNANWWVFFVGLPPSFGTVYGIDYANRTTAAGSSGSPITALTAPANGAYTLHANLSCHTQVSTATITLTFSWTDPGGTARSVTSSTATCTTLGTSDEVSVTREINVGSGQTVTYYTAIANSPHYDLNLRLEGSY